MVPVEGNAGFIDSHVHVWDTSVRHHAWLIDEPGLPRVATLAELGGDGVDGVVLVQADCDWNETRAETQWLESSGTSHLPILGVVAAARLEDPHVLSDLDWLAERPKVVGVRRLLQDQPPGFALTSEHVRGVQQAGERGLTVDLCVRPHQLDEVSRLVQQCPGTRFVLDHCGKPAIATWDQDDRDRWVRSLARLAGSGDVSCKLSGLLSEAGDAGAEQVADYLRRALDVFGPERSMFGSDWPVCTVGGSWIDWAALVTVEMASLSAFERGLVRSGTSAAVYGLSTHIEEGTAPC